MADHPAPLSPVAARALIDRLLEQLDTISFTAHCRAQSHKRRFDTSDIRRVLEQGLPTADSWNEKHQNWTYRLAGYDYDGESLTLVVVLEQDVIKIVTGYD